MDQHIPESMLKSRLFPSRISLLRLDIRRKTIIVRLISSFLPSFPVSLADHANKFTHRQLLVCKHKFGAG